MSLIKRRFFPIYPLLILAITLSMNTFVDAQETSTVISIVNPATGDGNFIFYTNTTSVGHRFNATVWVYNVSDLFAWQVNLIYNSSTLNATAAWQPTWDPEYVFYNQAVITPAPVFWPGRVLIGGSLLMVDDKFTGSGKLAIIEFEIIHAPPTEGFVFSTLEINNTDTFLLSVQDSKMLEVPASKIDGYYEFISLPPQPPIADFTYSPGQPSTDETVTFNASQSYDPDGSIIMYNWDFGDGNNGTGKITSHAYTVDGTYTVTLTVIDNDGLTNTTSIEITVSNRPPIAQFTESAETVDTDQTIHFNASLSYDPDGSIASYLWDFGDGNNAIGITVNHTYPDDGVYTVVLTVTDDDGASASSTAIKTVLNRPPVAVFTESAENVSTGATIYFNASSSYDADGSITDYLWDFGDGSNTSGLTVGHTYMDDGVYTVSLTVVDDDGAIDSGNAIKTVANRPPTAFFTESEETVYTHETIIFNASDSYDLDGSIESFLWDFGDGTTSTGPNVAHLYVDNATYTVTLIVTDDDGATNIATSTKAVLNRPPAASFTESAQRVHTDEVIHFNASQSVDLDGTIVSFFWDFGDGTSGTGIIASHSYVDDNIYTVSLTVVDDDGETDMATSTKTVVNRPPIPVFNYQPTTPVTTQTVTFNATDSYDPDGTIVVYQWNFSDGNVTTVPNPIISHDYTASGTYLVNLTVTDNDGSIYSITKPITIEKMISTLTINAEPEATTLGSYVTIHGNLTPARVGANVTIWHRLSGEAWASLPTVRTNLEGHYSYNWRTTDEGVHEVKASWSGDEGTSPAESETRTVTVDSTPPTTTIILSGLLGSSGWFTSNVTITLYAADDISEVQATEYKLGDTAWTIFVTPFNITGEGNITIYYRSTDSIGNTETTKKETIKIDKTIPSAQAGPDQIVNEDAQFMFNGSASSDNIDVNNYTWTFTDSGIQQILEDSNPTYTFETPGTYTITLNVTDAAGNWATDTLVIRVLDITKPLANAGPDQTVNVGTAVTFDAGGSSDNVAVTSYEWDFGDGTTAKGKTTTHTYAAPATYIVTLTVEDAAGNIGNASTTITVLSPETPPPPTEAFPTWTVGIAVAVMAIGATALAVFWRRRS